MIIHAYHRAIDMAALNEHLDNARKKRMYSPTRRVDQDILLVCEPQEMFSLGLKKDIQYIKDRRRFEEYQQEKNIPLVALDRGGGIFWHGPGQICLTPITDIQRLKLDPADYTAFLENLCIETLRAFDIDGITHQYTNEKTGTKQKGTRGVWVYDQYSSQLKKVAFLGWSSRGGIAIYGCAINISCDLYPFSLIHPCNLEGVEATSLRAIRNNAPSFARVQQAATRIWKENMASLYEKIK